MIAPTGRVASPAATPTDMSPSPISGSSLPPWSLEELPRLRWTRTDLVTDETEMVAAVAPWRGGFVAAGIALTFEMPPESSSPPGIDDLERVVFWHSDDGFHWVRSADDPVYHGALISNLVVLDDRLLAFGSAGICMPDACSLLPPNGGGVVFESTDGISWRRLERTGLEGGAVAAVARSGSTLIASGFVADTEGKPDTDAWSDPTDAAIWTSGDGLT